MNHCLEHSLSCMKVYDIFTWFEDVVETNALMCIAVCSYLSCECYMTCAGLQCSWGLLCSPVWYPRYVVTLIFLDLKMHVKINTIMMQKHSVFEILFSELVQNVGFGFFPPWLWKIKLDLILILIEALSLSVCYPFCWVLFVIFWYGIILAC